MSALNILIHALLASQPPDGIIAVRTAEGSLPTLTSYSVAGNFGQGRDFSLSFELDRSRWKVTLGFEGRRIDFSIPDVRVRFDQLLIRFSEGSPSRVLLDIRYGEPLGECFVNGGEVYRDINVQISSRIEAVYSNGFEGCEETEQLLHPTGPDNRIDF
jgi:hypothetical protein